LSNSYYIRNGNQFTVSDKASIDIYDNLPAGNYVVKFSDKTGFYLEQIESFERPSRFYGSTLRHADRIYNTFMDRESSTGVMAAGEKGSGKTLLGRELAIRCVENGHPVIIVNSPFCGDHFNKFIQSISQPAMIFFDEFEKVYDSEKQTAVLTLLDGVFPTKKLFFLTSNDKYRIDHNMRNRPGRIYYSIDFNGLEKEAIREYISDNLKNQGYADELVLMTKVYSSFNFDMLKAIVEEMNRYDESPKDSIKLINARPEYNSNETYEFTIYVDNRKLEDDLITTREYQGNPLMAKNIHSSFFKTAQDRKIECEGGAETEVYVKINPATDLIKIDNGQFVYVKDGYRFVLKKKKFDSWSMWDKVF